MSDLVAATFAAYYNSFDGVWIFNDYFYVIDNPFVRELWVFGTGYPHPYRKDFLKSIKIDARPRPTGRTSVHQTERTRRFAHMVRSSINE